MTPHGKTQWHIDCQRERAAQRAATQETDTMTEQEQNTMSIIHDFTDWTDTMPTQETDTMTDRPIPTDRIKASGKLVLYYNGTTTVMETLDHADTRIATVTENRSGDGYRIDTYLDRDQYSRGRDYSYSMNLTYTYNGALHLMIDILTS